MRIIRKEQQRESGLVFPFKPFAMLLREIERDIDICEWDKRGFWVRLAGDARVGLALSRYRAISRGRQAGCPRERARQAAKRHAAPRLGGASLSSCVGAFTYCFAHGPSV